MFRNPRLKAALLAAALATTMKVEAAPMTVLPSGHAVAEVMIEGQGPLRFVIDTAASITAVLPKLRAAMPGVLKPGSIQTLSGVSGDTKIETFSVDRFTVDGRTYSGLRVVGLAAGPVDGLGVDGILGSDVIARYAVEMDMPGRRWRMSEVIEPGATRGMHAPVPFALDSGLTPRLTVHLDGKPIAAALDTGAKGTIINWKAARLLGLSPDSPDIEVGTPVRGATAHATPSYTRVFGELRIGEAARAKPKVRIADLSVFKVLGMDDGPAMILGIDMLADRRIVIDHSTKRLFISAGSPVASTDGKEQPSLRPPVSAS